MNQKGRKRLRDLHARLGTSSAGERDVAWKKLDALLKKHNKTWNDLAELLREEPSAASTAPPPDPRDANQSDPFVEYTPVATVYGMLEKYVVLTEHEYLAVALWIMHTHVYDKFMVTPRLLLKSPVRNCGKTTLLDVIGRLARNTEKTDGVTAAGIYHTVSQTKQTLLLDEADNLEITAKSALRRVLNSGHRQGGKVGPLMIRGRPTKFDVFAPIALASIGASTISLPLLSRCVVIHCQRHDEEMKTRRRFDRADEEGMHDLDLVYSHIRHWVARTQLSTDPHMPAEVRGRQADNWRPLIAIADACSPDWGARAREAAIVFTRGDHDEDLGVMALHHIRLVFNADTLDRIASQALVAAMIHLDEADAMWAEYRGPHGTERPHKLTQNALATLLRPFGIRPHTVWPPRRDAKAKGPRGYLRSDFEDAWRRYCDEGQAPPHGPRLRLVSDTR